MMTAVVRAGSPEQHGTLKGNEPLSVLSVSLYFTETVAAKWNSAIIHFTVCTGAFTTVTCEMLIFHPVGRALGCGSDGGGRGGEDVLIMNSS